MTSWLQWIGERLVSLSGGLRPGGVSINGKTLNGEELPLTDQLQFGQTPWDQLSRAELLTEVQRLYSATVSLHSSLSMIAMTHTADPYFGGNGTGGKALEKGKQALTKANRGHESDVVYHSFFRYADDLLFEPPVGQGWLVDEAGTMVARSREHSLIYHNAEASAAGMPHMKGYLHRLTWKDLEPKTWNT